MVSGAEPAVDPGAREIVSRVVDPEMPMLTLDDLGVIRAVDERADAVTVTITPTYSGCPAIEIMREDIRAALADAGYRGVQVRTVFSPAWSTDWITEAGRRKLAEAGIAPPGRAPAARNPVALALRPPDDPVRCPRCGAPATEEISRFGPTPCTALRRCRCCREPFEHMKEL
jgi:ring-1,2-phenylacetyl-CoA epoxidase subunit PaaD